MLVPDADDELAGGAVMLHVVVGLPHLLQAVVDAVHGEGQPAGRDRADDVLEGVPRQVGGVPGVARQAHTLRQVLVRGEVAHRPLVGEAAAETDRAVHPHRAQSVGQGRRADQIKAGVDAVRVQLPHGRRDLTGVEQSVVDTVLRQRRETVGPPGGGQYGGAAPRGQRGGGQPHRGGAAADQHGLIGLQIQADGERAVGGLHHLRQGAQHLPGQVGVDRDDLGQRHRGVLGIAAVIGAAHVPHHRDDLLPGRQAAAGRGRVHDAGGLDTRHPGKGDPHAQPKPKLQLRAVEAERLDSDPHPAVPLRRQRKRDQPQVLHRTRGGKRNGAHGARRGHHRPAFIPGNRVDR